MSTFVLIQGSLNPTSKTSIVMEIVKEKLLLKGHNVDYLDLRSITMEFCDGRPLKDYNHDLQDSYKRLEKGEAFIIGMPVYQYTVSGPLKNFFDIVATALKDKLVGIVLTSGGVRSYMAAMDLFNLLALEVGSTSVMPIIHTSEEDYQGTRIMNPKVNEKIDALITKMEKLLCQS